MQRGGRLIFAAAVIVVAPLMSACSDMVDKFETLELFDTKKKLSGERKPVFPEGVPGATSGVPAELVKGYQQPEIRAGRSGQSSRRGGSSGDHEAEAQTQTAADGGEAAFATHRGEASGDFRRRQCKSGTWGRARSAAAGGRRASSLAGAAAPSRCATATRLARRRARDAVVSPPIG